MLKRALPFIAIFAVACMAQAAETENEIPRLKALEQSIEASTATVRLPERTPASMFARTCETCPTVTLQVTQTTRFFLGKAAVTQSEFNQAVQKVNPDPTLGIFYDSKTSEVTRLVAFGLGNKPAATTKNRRGK